MLGTQVSLFDVRDLSKPDLLARSAAIDARAEHALFESIRTLFAGRTVLLISHRFSSVLSTDRIFVLAGGRLVEQGTHAELMDARELSAELFTLQAEAYRD